MTFAALSPDNSPSEDQPWPQRKRQAEEVCEALCQSPGNTKAAAGVVAFASDPKWEVRKVVAEALAGFPEDVYRKLAPVLCGDSNALVRAAAERSVDRRTPISGIATATPGVIQSAIERIETRHGPDAAQAAVRLAEKFTELHLRSAVHDVKNILTHFGLDVAELAAAVPDPTTSAIKEFRSACQQKLGCGANDVILTHNGGGYQFPATKGRIMRHRPRFDCWSARFTVRVNEDLLPPDFIHQLLVEGGQQIGIGDFRPEKGGPFGTFNLVGWKEAK